MLFKLKQLFTPKELLAGEFGIEREMLRVDGNGDLSTRPHPKVFGEKMCHPYITTDFSESQVEVITPTFRSLEEAHGFLNVLYDIVTLNIEDEYLW